VLESVRIPDGNDDLAGLELVGVSQSGGDNVRRVNLDDGQVGVGVVANRMAELERPSGNVTRRSVAPCAT
jgi:hypothetical protein